MEQTSKGTRAELRVAIVGLGPIGGTVAEAMDRGIDGRQLTAVAVQNPGKHRTFLAALKQSPAIAPIDGLADLADLVIECAPAKLLNSIVAIKRKRPFLTRR
jgi:aspartate dehydrogenase